MTGKELDDILNNLDLLRMRKREIETVKAQAELKAIEREYLAYYDGAYDAIKAVKMAMGKPKEG